MALQKPTLTLAIILSLLFYHFTLIAANPLALKNPNGDTCPAPQIQCEHACCSSQQTCSANGHCLNPVPGKLWITYYTDLGTDRSNLIELHGSGFVSGASISIYAEVEFEYSPGVPAWMIQTYFEVNDPTTTSFDYKTGVQDCGVLRDGQNLGQKTEVEAWDPHVNVLVSANDVRAPKDGGVGKLGNCYSRA